MRLKKLYDRELKRTRLHELYRPIGPNFGNTSYFLDYTFLCAISDYDDLREMAKKAAWSVSSCKSGNGV
ncbi:hypothetical protein Syun_026256 [Stephania yunnanensis]|uniref:DOC domain-containing protein n=1 Tax=Stephania yunnanensis TaxID=152371 RepID=A0AAP0HWI8_9MAGN